MASLQKLETARLRRPADEGFDYDSGDMAELLARCLLARVPQYLADLYELANVAPRHPGKLAQYPDIPAPQAYLNEARDGLASTLIEEAAILLARGV
jgi:hypothetical protein